MVILQYIFYALLPIKVRKLALEFAELDNLGHPFKKVKRVAGIDCLQYFMNASDLYLHTVEAPSMTRVAGLIRLKIKRFIDRFKHLKMSLGVKKGTKENHSSEVY